ncbi:FAD:protein FMN transferase [Roseibium salinum]|nr:FAD:protein FMN transferase [Roseibium salinum]
MARSPRAARRPTRWSRDRPAGPSPFVRTPHRSDAQVKLHLSDAAVASSARLGTTFDQSGTRSHILDPKSGEPVRSGLTAASVIARTAALADGLSTAALVCGEERLAIAMAGFPATRAFVVRDDGADGWLG